MKTLAKFFMMAAATLVMPYAKAQSVTMKDPVSFKLKNGMTVIVAENKDINKVYSSFTTEAVADIQSNKAGIQDVLNVMLNETATQTNAGVSFNEKGGNVASTATDFNDALNALSASVQLSALNQSAFEKAKATVIASVKAKDHYYADDITETALQGLTLNDVKAFFSKNITPEKTYLTIAGNITVANAKVLAKKSFGNWE